MNIKKLHENTIRLLLCTWLGAWAVLAAVVPFAVLYWIFGGTQ